MPRVSRSGGPVRAKAATEYIADAPTLKAKTPLANGARSRRRFGRVVSSHSFVACWTQKPAAEIVNSSRGDRSLRWVMAKNGIP